jgi:serine/threonine protein kinase
MNQSIADAAIAVNAAPQRHLQRRGDHGGVLNCRRVPADDGPRGSKFRCRRVRSTSGSVARWKGRCKKGARFCAVDACPVQSQQPFWLLVERSAAYGEPVDGTPFGRYRLVELLGRGGMGEVWHAHDTVTDRTVAIKVLPVHLSEDEDFQRRFRREAHAAARLNSPHVIPIHNYGEIDGRLYLDMRLIKGRDLATLIADGPLDPTRAVHIVGQVAKALHAAHEEGLLHRDIKPSNILLDRDDFAYLIDFGIARTLGETRMTQTGNAIGTFHYIAPERLAIGADEDARADIYSLACVLYECLTGSPPFPGDTMPQLVAAHLSAPPPRPSISQPKVPVQVDEVIATGMAKDPDQRYATTLELANAARDAMTTPVGQPVPPPIRPGTDVVRRASAPTLSRTIPIPRRPNRFPVRRSTPPFSRPHHLSARSRPLAPRLACRCSRG